jgi:hypothetical protein
MRYISQVFPPLDEECDSEFKDKGVPVQATKGGG